MQLHVIFFTIFIFFSVFYCQAQRIPRQERQAISRLFVHLSILSHDSLEGRRAGTTGEQKAACHIQRTFESSGLRPMGTEGSFLQPFPVPAGKQVSNNTYLRVNKMHLSAVDFLPLSISGNGRTESVGTLPAVSEKGQAWFLDLVQFLKDQPQHPHFDLQAALLDKAESVRKAGATALLLYSTLPIHDTIQWFDSRYKGSTANIPIVYIKKGVLEKLWFNPEHSYDISLEVNIEKMHRTAHNVIAYLDRKAPYTIIIGAHYDHLGRGEDGNSMVRNGQQGIHNGADDNASGTAALLELSHQFAQNRTFNTHNLLFIAFSGEELGLLGSRYFTENPTISLANVNFMINMDMVGRIIDSTKRLTIGGYGTSPRWSTIFSSIHERTLTLTFDSSGTGPSDHTSFYRKDIPVLFFFTGLHSDYHKPSDDAEKINIEGISAITQLIKNIILQVDGKEKLVFSKTRDRQTTTNARFTVSLGIMPDYAFAGSGVRIDGVSEGRPAIKAGLTSGDILIQIGNFKVTSVESYMQALSKFKKGDTTEVIIRRNNANITYQISF